MTSAARLSAAAVLGGSAWSLLRPAAAQPPGIELVRLREDITVITGAGGNVVVVPGAAASVVVDSGSADSADALQAALDSVLGGSEPQILLNTHWHDSHTGGNEHIRGTNTRILAHVNTRRWMSTQFYVRWEDKTYLPRVAEALPTETFFSTDPQPLRIAAGSHTIEYGHLANAHTDGDIYVFVPERNVLIAGGAVAAHEYPLIDYSTGGWIDGLIDASQLLLRMCDDETLIVPGRGPALRRDHIVAQHEMVTALREGIAEQMRLGKGVDEIVAMGLTAEFDEIWGRGNNGPVFVSNIYADLAWRGPGGSL